jgi:C4-type Zn-finger protein
MGIYNIVKFQINCPVCGKQITEFQTKEGDGVLEIIEYYKVNNFHAICPHCQSLVEFYYSPERAKRTLKDYKMRIVELKK